ncbi:hypothetical protein [Bacillus albus]|uniref:hypothetical protein n=1 Tax=Bacillus albus TaxID=2026189 RepID=UPI001F5CF073|nr:hypothetical protein [Bacillus albus]
MKVKKIVLIDGEYEDVVVTSAESSEVEIFFSNMIKVTGDDFTVFVNVDMVVSLELAPSNDKGFSIVRSKVGEKDEKEPEFRYTIKGEDFELHTNDPMAVRKIAHDFVISVRLQTAKNEYTQYFLKSEITVVDNHHRK